MESSNTSPLALIFSFIALVLTIWQISANKKNSRRINAYSIYQDYLKLTIQYPEYASGNMAFVNQNKQLQSQYSWFLANAFLAFEEILTICKNEQDWAIAISHQLARHAWHMSKSKSIQRGDWKPALKRLIDKEIEIYVKGSDAIPPAETMIFFLERTKVY